MNNKFTKFKNWISASFQFITVGLLAFAIALILKQQKDINDLRDQVETVQYKMDSLDRKVDDVEDNISKDIDDSESNLLNEIDRVRRAVIIWSN